MQGQIPWNIIGPAGALVIVVLILVFGFILKYQAKKGSNSGPPKDINSTGKKTLCFEHHRDIASNQTAIEMICEQLKTTSENNRKDHKDMFTKIEGLGTKIIEEIHKANGDT